VVGTPLYFDTNIYTPDYRPPAEDFYRAIRDQRCAKRPLFCDAIYTHLKTHYFTKTGSG
jgi:hypothetical protein